MPENGTPPLAHECADCHTSFDDYRVVLGRLVCRKCLPAARKAAKQKKRTGEGFAQRAQSAEEIAAKIERITRGRLRWQEQVKQRKALQLAGKEAPSAWIGTHVARRHYEVMLGHLAGLTNADIARQLGYSSHITIARILKAPYVVEKLREIDTAREKMILEGRYGVRAQAKAAGPKAMKKVIDDGLAAPKAADRTAANRLVLQVSGDLVDRRETHRFQHVIADMSVEELFQLKRGGGWPERYRDLMDKLGMNAQPAIDVTPE